MDKVLAIDYPNWLAELVNEFPYEHKDGVCEMLEGGSCKDFKNRPVICNGEKLRKHTKLSQEEWDKGQAQTCKTLKKEIGLCGLEMKLKLRNSD